MSISLTKNQTINLTKDNGSSLTSIRMGLGWDAKTTQKKGLFGGTKTVEKAIDLDASVIMIGGGAVRDIVFFGQKGSRDGSILHDGDNVTGAGDGDDEVINVDLARVDPATDHLVFVVTSYSGDTFGDIENAFVRMVDATNGNQEVARFSITTFDDPRATAMVMGVAKRNGGNWEFRAVGTPAMGKRAHDIQREALASC